MIQTINFNQFCDSFSGSYKDNFSYEGKRALFDYLEQYEEETGEQIELDPVALCCEYTEFDNFADFSSQYPDCTTIQDVQDNTQVIEVDSGSLEDGQGKFIILNY